MSMTTIGTRYAYSRVAITLLLGILMCASTSHSFLQVVGHSTKSSSTITTTTTTLSLNNFFKFNQPQEPDKKQPKDTSDLDPTTAQSQDSAYDPDDPVEKIFGFFFGKRELEPMGMKRFGRERFPEQYPATTTEWADPIPSDSSDMLKKLRPLLKNTNLEARPLKLTYDANRNGWNANAFHKAVDKLGPGLVVCTTNDGLICGGYNPKGWVGYGEARGSIAAFLFVFDSPAQAKSVTSSSSSFGVTKLRKVGGPSFAQQDLPELGPSFGADSLVIPFLQDNPKMARSKLGSYFERFDDGTNTLFKTSASVQLRDLKVYHGVYEKDEYIPFTDAEPFALY